MPNKTLLNINLIAKTIDCDFMFGSFCVQGKKEKIY